MAVRFSFSIVGGRQHAAAVLVDFPESRPDSVTPSDVIEALQLAIDQQRQKLDALHG